MQTQKKTLAVAGTDIFTVPFSPGVTGFEVVACSGELTLTFTGGNGAGTFLAKAGDAFKFDRGFEPAGCDIVSDTNADTIEIRYMRGQSWRLPNATLLISNPLPVSGSQPFGSSLVALAGYEAPTIPGMILDESHQGIGPFDVKPLGTYTGLGLLVEETEDSDGFLQAFASAVTVQRACAQYGSLRFVFGSSAAPAGTMTFQDQQLQPIPIFRVSTGAWIFTGIAPAGASDVYYVPLNGVGLLNCVYSAAADTDGHFGFSPRPVPAFV